MGVTFTCRLDDKVASFYDVSSSDLDVVSVKQFEQYIGRRQFNKLSSATHIAGAIFHKYFINDKLREMGGDPANTPLVICNRFANWDYVAEIMSPSSAETMSRVNSYVATAWFPAALQGYLTIQSGNIGEAITISTEDTDMICATIKALMPVNIVGRGALVLGTFECIPNQIGGVDLTGDRPKAFGAISLIKSGDTPEAIRSIVLAHQEMYANVD
ncbi:hypothetical protein HBO04_07770 [Pseudomonas proteolytica]|uniref:hypothetical protein n=1 Tax=Pseudomonas proteolytica TaxID=219574 RepID=UPI001476358A|nr:hypothetical protein [Pseudomonas proteolytica]NMZ00012.1 hypothetical protein [Pseudomonas proteolytica]